MYVCVYDHILSFYLRNDFPKGRFLNIFLRTPIHSSLGDPSVAFCIPYLEIPP